MPGSQRQQSGPPERQPSRAWRLKLATLGGTLVLSLGAAELVTRCSSGYQLLSPRLVRSSPPVSAVDGAFASAAELVRGFLAQNEVPGVDPAWIRRVPPSVKTYTVSAALRARVHKFGFQSAAYHFNEAWLREHWIKGHGLDVLGAVPSPPDYLVYSVASGAPRPSYRFPPSATLPSGLTTNAFGFRGRQVELNKPARTVRIACVGASTTVCQHDFLYSYPELVEHWLQLWSQSKGLGIRFEVLNAGREAINSSDVRAIVEHEVLPLAVDYVIYYEGANQFHRALIAKLVRATEPVTSLDPPAELGIPSHGIPAEESWLGRWARFSALADRSRSVLRSASRWPEPPKPAQHISLPEGLDPRAPRLDLARDFAKMAVILSDLDRIRMASEGAGARLVLCSFAWLVHEGLVLHPVRDRNLMAGLNRAFWPIRYDILRQLVDIQNRFFATWAQARSVDFIDVAGRTPADPVLFNDQYHGTQLGLRVRAWLVFTGLVRLIERDLAAGRLPSAPTRRLQQHPGIGPVHRVTAAELNAK